MQYFIRARLNPRRPAVGAFQLYANAAYQVINDIEQMGIASFPFDNEVFF